MINMVYKYWSGDDVAWLMKFYPKEGAIGLNKKFPYRSSHSIRTMAHELGVKCNREHISFVHNGKNNGMHGKSGELAPRFGCHHTEEAKRKIGLAQKDKIVSAMTRKKQRLAKLGRKLSKEHKRKIGNAHIGDKSHMKRPENRRKMSIIATKRYEDPKERAKMRKCGLKAIKVLRENAPYIYRKCKFDSGAEMECAKLLFEAGRIGRIIEGKTVHVRMNGAEVDFQLDDGTFVEYHKMNPFYRNDFNLVKLAKQRGTNPIREYYRIRRKILNRNGFQKNSLMVFQSIHQVREFINS